MHIFPIWLKKHLNLKNNKSRATKLLWKEENSTISLLQLKQPTHKWCTHTRTHSYGHMHPQAPVLQAVQRAARWFSGQMLARCISKTLCMIRMAGSPNGCNSSFLQYISSPNLLQHLYSLVSIHCAINCQERERERWWNIMENCNI